MPLTNGEALTEDSPTWAPWRTAQDKAVTVNEVTTGRLSLSAVFRDAAASFERPPTPRSTNGNAWWLRTLFSLGRLVSGRFSLVIRRRRRLMHHQVSWSSGHFKTCSGGQSVSMTTSNWYARWLAFSGAFADSRHRVARRIVRWTDAQTRCDFNSLTSNRDNLLVKIGCSRQLVGFYTTTQVQQLDPVNILTQRQPRFHERLII